MYTKAVPDCKAASCSHCRHDHPLVCSTTYVCHSHHNCFLQPHGFSHTSPHPQVYKAMPYNKNLVRSINRVKELQRWPWEAGGGPVLDPRALVVLGDMTEFYREDEQDAFRHLYDPAIAPPPADTAPASTNATASSSIEGTQGQQQPQPVAGSSSSNGSSEDGGPAQVQLPTWLMFGNHDYVLNVNDCAGHYKSTDRNVCARMAVDTMRSVLTPGCDTATWANFPRNNVTSFDAESLAYSFDYNDWHFVVLQYSPRWVQGGAACRASGWGRVPRQGLLLQPVTTQKAGGHPALVQLAVS